MRGKPNQLAYVLKKGTGKAGLYLMHASWIGTGREGSLHPVFTRSLWEARFYPDRKSAQRFADLLGLTVTKVFLVE